MSKKKLLVTASTFPRWEGDTEPRFVLDMCKALTKYFDVTVLVPAAPGAADAEDLEGVHVIRYRYFPIRRWESLCYPGAIVPRIKEKKVRALLVPFLMLGLWWNLLTKLKAYDMVHVHWLIPQGIVQWMFKKPYLVTGHGGDVYELNKGFSGWLKKKCIQNAGQVTVVSQALAAKLKELAPECEPTVLSMGVDTTAFSPEYRVDDYFNQGDKKVILFVGRLAEKKGVKYLIEAMQTVENARLTIVGNGPLEGELKAQVKDLQLEDKVQFLGSKTHGELKEIYPSADVMVVPSITASNGDQEGVPTTIAEAMASGVPVVACDSGGIAEIVRNNENGFLVPEKDSAALADAINKLLSDEQLKSRFIAAGHITACDRSYESLGARYAKLLGRL